MKITTNPDANAYPPRYIGASEEGLTKREWFAGLALQGILANSEHGHVSLEYHIRFAVQSADALIQELNETKCKRRK